MSFPVEMQRKMNTKVYGGRIMAVIKFFFPQQQAAGGFKDVNIILK